MKSMKLTVATVAVAVMGLLSADATAGEGCCHCGDNCGVRKVCRLKDSTRKIEKVCFGCKCEDYCISGKACQGCLHCENNCDKNCDCQQPCDACSKECKEQRPWCCLKWFDYKPLCAEVRTKKKLIIYKATKEVPSWKWEVEEVCANCCPSCHCSTLSDGMEVESPSPQQVQQAEESEAPIPAPPTARQAGFTTASASSRKVR
jgi:hypothetical protein